MKYYIPTSSSNFNNILSTESISPKAFYEKRGFGYARWFTIEENNIDRVILLYDSPHNFERPVSDIEDHPMLIEIDTDDEYPQISNGIFYSDKTIYLNPWQTKFFFFSDKVKKTVMSLSDSSLETKLIRLYERNMYVKQFEGKYSIIQDTAPIQTGDIDKFIEEDYITNKMKGLLYGYYIGANLSSSKEQILKLDSLREIQNIFSSVISSYDRIPSSTQNIRLNALFDIIEHQQPIYVDLQKELRNKELVEKVLNILQHHGYIIRTIDRNKLIKGLQSDSVNNPSMNWVKREIAKTNSIADTHRVLLKPDDEEIIVSSNDRVISQKTIDNELMRNLFVNWTNSVLCSRSFNGKINSINEPLSDEITRSAKEVIGLSDWDNSYIRAYLNQLRRHVRGEEFHQPWDNGVLSSMAAVLLKGDDWEQLLHFMQSKGMYDYRLAFAIYGILNGFANLTRDFTDLLLNQESSYLAEVYREMHGQLHGKSIPTSTGRNKPQPIVGDSTNISEGLESLNVIVYKYVAEFEKANGKKMPKQNRDSIEKALNFTSDGKILSFLMKLNDFPGFTRRTPKSFWTYLKDKACPEYDQITTTKTTPKKPHKQDNSPSLFEQAPILSVSDLRADSEMTNPTSIFFVDDINVKYFINNRPYLPNEIREILCKKIVSFQRDYAPDGYYYGKEESPRTNDNTIKHFINKCTFIKNDNSSWIPATTENKQLLERLKSELYDRYANR